MDAQGRAKGSKHSQCPLQQQAHRGPMTPTTMGSNSPAKLLPGKLDFRQPGYQKSLETGQDYRRYIVTEATASGGRTSVQLSLHRSRTARGARVFGWLKLFFLLGLSAYSRVASALPSL